jgi:superfamily II RNA helicase
LAHDLPVFPCILIKRSTAALVTILICLLLGIQIPCDIDTQFAGMVEAWASGLTWREIMMDSAMDDGDLARLLRRTMDLLVQVYYQECR